MKTTREPTLQDIDELIGYLPRLYAAGFSPVLHWEESKKGKDGAWSMPYPHYHPLTEEFFRKLAGAWIDYEYDQEQASRMLRDENLIKTASLAQIKTMLTFCVRGERFSDGHWENMIQKGHIRRLLERLREIKSDIK